MKRPTTDGWMWLGMAAAIVLGILGLGASNPYPPTPGPRTEPPADREIIGYLSATDVAARTITVATRVSSETFKLTPEATIMIEGDGPAELSDLQLGDQVTVSYREQDGARVATRVIWTRLKPPPGR